MKITRPWGLMLTCDKLNLMRVTKGLNQMPHAGCYVLNMQQKWFQLLRNKHHRWLQYVNNTEPLVVFMCMMEEQYLRLNRVLNKFLVI